MFFDSFVTVGRKAVLFEKSTELMVTEHQTLCSMQGMALPSCKVLNVIQSADTVRYNAGNRMKCQRWMLVAV